MFTLYHFFFFILTILILVYMYRVFQGPTVYDRILGLNGISTKAIILLTILGSLYSRLEMFVDIALGYAVLNIVGGLAVGKYLEHKGTRKC
ncbi:TPA: pH regulation protein F [Candidatus Poribacteria bacterium]|jgi:multicomponent Na+:H+ antiporter subunit F|nr:pH regulation protein F [Candidatus Poribacteria bacterium]|tara:strand:+ start:708 stop:980 length:273 start_codon:yes stop_codon:yes gene_type:complete